MALQRQSRICLCVSMALLMVVSGIAVAMLQTASGDESDVQVTISAGGGGGGGGALPDLKVTDIWTSPASPVGGQPVTIYANVYNAGKNCRYSFYNHLMVDSTDNTISAVVIYGLDAGESYVHSKTVTLSAGTHQLIGYVDYFDNIEESNDYNNMRSEQYYFSSTSLPDVSAVDIWTDPSSPVGGQSAMIYFRIFTGSVPFTTTITTTLKIDTALKSTKTLYGSPGGETITYYYTTTLAAGSHTLLMETDASYALAESSETNNMRTEIISWADIDSDGDGLTDSYELSIGTDPFDPTTDADAWNDGDEVLKYYTNPLLADTDGDTVMDHQDYDPLNNLQVTVKIEEVFARDLVDTDGADFWWLVTVNGNVRSSAMPWAWNSNHVYPGWTTTVNVPDNVRYVSIEIDLLDYEGGGANEWCDIDDTGTYNNDFLEITYDVCTGSWSGDDHFSDISGYGHADGTLDGIQSAPDCAIWFSIYQDDDDGDGMAYWEEVNTYNSNPVSVNDAGGNWDSDGMPNGWEDSNGLNPLVYDANGDLDSDGVRNVYEYDLRGRGKSASNPLDSYGLDLSITLMWDADYQYMGFWASGMEIASNILFEATNGYFFIRSVTIYDNTANLYSSDIAVLDEVCDNPWFHSWPHLCHDPLGDNIDDNGDMDTGPKDDSGYRHWIMMPRLWQREDDGPIENPSALNYSQAVVHELGHYAFCVHEEYMDSSWDLIDETERLQTIMALPHDPNEYYEFSTLVDYQNPPPGTNIDTYQWFMFGESCWQTIFGYWNYFSAAKLHGLGTVWSLLPGAGNRDLGVQFDLNENGVIDTGYTNGYVADTFSSIYEYDVGLDMICSYQNT